MQNHFPQPCATVPDDDAALTLAMSYDAGLEAARAGVQELQACLSDLPFEGCPEHHRRAARRSGERPHQRRRQADPHGAATPR